MTEVIQVNPTSPEPDAIARAAKCLRGGGLVAFPTETVYGLGVHALDRTAVRRLFDAKRRPATDPLIVHVGGFDQVAALVTRVPVSAEALANRFWPGPLTLVLPRAPIVPNEVTAGLATVAVRVPSHPVALALIVAAGVPIAAPSANLFSRPSPTDAAHVLEDLDGRIDMLLDAGATTIGVESTVVDLSGEIPTVLRPGAVTIEMLREVLPRVDAADLPSRGEAATSDVSMPSPGMLEKHYSPRAPLTLYEGPALAALSSIVEAVRRALETGQVVGIVAAEEDREVLGPLVESNRSVFLCTIGSQERPKEAASRLYGSLRELDAAGADVILVRGFAGEEGLGVAVRDRLRRAAAGRIVQC